MRYVVCLMLAVVTGFSSLATDRGLLFRVSKPGKGTSYIYGTMHVRDQRAFRLSDSVLPAIRKCKVFANEADMDSAAVLLTKRAGEDIYKELLTDPEDDKSESETRKSSWNDDKYRDSIRTLLLDTAAWKERLRQFSSARDSSKNDSDSQTVVSAVYGKEYPVMLDLYLLAYAESQGLRTTGLETPESAIELLESMESHVEPRSGTTPWLRRARIRRQRAELIKMYQAGDIEGLLHVDAFEDTAFVRLLLDDRNVVMAESIDSIAAHETVFAAVGAAHLAGPNGLIQLLRAKGYTVSAVKATYKQAPPSTTLPTISRPTVEFASADGKLSMSFPEHAIINHDITVAGRRYGMDIAFCFDIWTGVFTVAYYVPAPLTRDAAIDYVRTTAKEYIPFYALSSLEVVDTTHLGFTAYDFKYETGRQALKMSVITTPGSFVSVMRTAEIGYEEKTALPQMTLIPRHVDSTTREYRCTPDGFSLEVAGAEDLVTTVTIGGVRTYTWNLPDAGTELLVGVHPMDCYSLLRYPQYADTVFKHFVSSYDLKDEPIDTVVGTEPAKFYQGITHLGYLQLFMMAKRQKVYFIVLASDQTVDGSADAILKTFKVIDSEPFAHASWLSTDSLVTIDMPLGVVTDTTSRWLSSSEDFTAFGVDSNTNVNYIMRSYTYGDYEWFNTDITSVLAKADSSFRSLDTGGTVVHSRRIEINGYPCHETLQELPTQNLYHLSRVIVRDNRRYQFVQLGDKREFSREYIKHWMQTLAMKPASDSMRLFTNQLPKLLEDAQVTMDTVTESQYMAFSKFGGATVYPDDARTMAHWMEERLANPKFHASLFSKFMASIAKADSRFAMECITKWYGTISDPDVKMEALECLTVIDTPESHALFKKLYTSDAPASMMSTYSNAFLRNAKSYFPELLVGLHKQHLRGSVLSAYAELLANDAVDDDLLDPYISPLQSYAATTRLHIQSAYKPEFTPNDSGYVYVHPDSMYNSWVADSTDDNAFIAGLSRVAVLLQDEDTWSDELHAIAILPPSYYAHMALDTSIVQGFEPPTETIERYAQTGIWRASILRSLERANKIDRVPLRWRHPRKVMESLASDSYIAMMDEYANLPIKVLKEETIGDGKTDAHWYLVLVGGHWTHYITKSLDTSYTVMLVGPFPTDDKPVTTISNIKVLMDEEAYSSEAETEEIMERMLARYREEEAAGLKE